MPDLAFLGPEGTFTHRAALDLAREGETLRPLDHAEEVVSALTEGRVDSAVIAFENSLEGPVSANLDLLLATNGEILITGERVLPVVFGLWRRPDDETPLQAVTAHAFGLAQCSRFIRERGLQTKVASSNGVACREVAASTEPGWGALAGPEAGARHGLVLVEERLHDAEASTRFLRLGRQSPAPTGRDLSAFVLYPDHLRSGSLVSLLQEFAIRDINLTSIKSRPTKELLGEYVFFVEAEGHLREQRLRDATTGLLRSLADVRFLGSYPQDRDRQSSARRHDDDAIAARLQAMVERTAR
ncbi:prephenate dehydratase [Patulibacter defluvii]|uniref:prephenate dehydratase n=1 Tax=Patulibacter defluvii TaxID=3095358 RepID=UPI002A74D83F|nr:prephenate dehydratase domain-containing protein [Patulibacter sp. DM4]